MASAVVGAGDDALTKTLRASAAAVDPDAALMARVVARDQQALGELYDRHCGLIYGLALRIVTERAEAEAVVHHVFVTVWERAASFHLASETTPYAWLVRLTRDRAIERQRVLGLHGEVRVPIYDESTAIGRGLATLPSVQRVLIEHAYYTGATRSELGQRFGLSRAEVTNSLRVGMRALRSALERPTAKRA